MTETMLERHGEAHSRPSERVESLLVELYATRAAAKRNAARADEAEAKLAAERREMAMKLEAAAFELADAKSKIEAMGRFNRALKEAVSALEAREKARIEKEEREREEFETWNAPWDDLTPEQKRFHEPNAGKMIRGKRGR